MDSNGKWETVVNKKKGQVTKSDVKKAQQKFIDGEKTPKVEARDPIKLDQTVYAGFESKKFNESGSDDEEKYPSRIPYEQSKDGEDKSPKNVKRKDKKIKKQPPVVDMIAKIKKVSCDALIEKIKEVQGKFPTSQLIWLKEVTLWLNSELTGPNEKGDIAYVNKKEDYPLCDVTPQVINELVKLMATCEKNVLNSFFTFLLASLQSEVQQGHSTIAYRLLIQVLCTVQSDIVADNCQEVVSNKSRNSDTYLAIIWALSQGKSTLKKSLEVWWSSMYNTLDKKHHAVASMNYLFQLLSSAEVSRIDTPIISTDQIVQFIELMVGTNSLLQHTPSLMTSLQSHWSNLIQLLLGDGSRDRGKAVFANILPKLRNQEDEKISIKVCDLLVRCLLLSRNCLAWWEENFIHHMKESSVLFKYIQACPDTVSNQVNKFHRSNKVLYYSTQRMLERLEKVNERGRLEKKAGYKDFRKLCLAYIRHEDSRKCKTSKIWKLLKVIVLLLLVAVSYDFYVHKGYKGSVTSVYMKKYGIENRALVAFNRSKQLTDSVVGFCQTHVPYYYGKISIYIEPALEFTWHYITISIQFIYERSQPVRAYANQYVPPLLEKISDFLSEQYRIASTFLVNLFNEYAPIIETFTLNVYTCLSENIPLAYNYVVNLLCNLKQTIYELNPKTFDQISIAVNDAWMYVVKTTSIVRETVGDYVNRCLVAGNGYVEKGQTWLQQLVIPNASPASTPK